MLQAEESFAEFQLAQCLHQEERNQYRERLWEHTETQTAPEMHSAHPSVGVRSSRNESPFQGAHLLPVQS